MLKFKESEFTWNLLINFWKDVLRSFQKSCTFWLVINTLVSSANNIGIALCVTVVSKSLIYNRNNKGPKTDLCGTPCCTLVHPETALEFRL
jgi:hypothetical protein